MVYRVLSIGNVADIFALNLVLIITFLFYRSWLQPPSMPHWMMTRRHWKQFWKLEEALWSLGSVILLQGYAIRVRKYSGWILWSLRVWRTSTDVWRCCTDTSWGWSCVRRTRSRLGTSSPWIMWWQMTFISTILCIWEASMSTWRLNSEQKQLNDKPH